MRLHPGTFITDLLFYIPQNEKIAPNIAAKIVRVNGPLVKLQSLFEKYRRANSVYTCITRRKSYTFAPISVEIVALSRGDTK